MKDDYETVTLKVGYNLEGCRPDEREWAEEAIRAVHQFVADVANEYGIEMYNAMWELKHPNHGVMRGALLAEYDEGYENFMKLTAEMAARTVGLSPDRTRIVRMRSVLDCLLINWETETGLYNGIVEDYKP